MNLQPQVPYVHSQLQTIIFDSLAVDNVEKKLYKEPVITKHCNHPRSCFEKQEAIEEIMLKKFYQCPAQACQKIAKNVGDLIQDWRSQAYQEFNQYISEVTVIRGIMVNKYVRNKTRYQNFFMEEVYGKQFLNMFERISQENSINFLMKNNLSSGQDQNRKIQFWSFCLQDRVKITIPVRIIGCKHYECYELTSLLFYQQQNYQKKQFLECTQPGCSNRLKIVSKDFTSTGETQNQNNVNQTQNNAAQVEGQSISAEDIQTLFSGICVDFDLLNAIKRSHPSSYKFYYNQTTGQIEEDVQKNENGKIIDPLIAKYYQSNKELQQKQQFDDFQNSILQSAISVSQGDLLIDDKQLGTRIALYKYRNYKVKMVDLLTNMIIEYPVRCKFCTDLSVCMDMRSYIADFTYQKKIFPNKNYTCPLCKTQQKSTLIKTTIQSNIYLDSNMLSYMFKDMSYTQGTQVFEYKGQQYMLQEFMDRQKIRREDYIVNLKEAVEFKQLFCILNPKLRIKEPLVLSKCSQKNIVDFQSFYDELKKIDFDIENIGLTLCKCLSCNQNPIKTITGNIHFHEPFYEALNKFSKIDNQTKLEKFTYKFEKTEEESYVVRELIQINNPKIKVVQQPKQMDAQNLINVKGNEGFVDLMNDEEYQKFFGATQIQGFAYKAQGMQQNIGVLQIDYGKDGIRANVEEAVEKLNQNANSQLKQFHFNVVGMQVQLKNDVFNQNKGEFKFQK